VETTANQKGKTPNEHKNRQTAEQKGDQNMIRWQTVFPEPRRGVSLLWERGTASAVLHPDCSMLYPKTAPSSIQTVPRRDNESWIDIRVTFAL
jgi:hypothetical protein